MNRFQPHWIFFLFIALASCKSSYSPVEESNSKVDNTEVIHILKEKKVINVPYKQLTIAELMSILEVEDKGIAEVNAYGHLNAWMNWKYPYEFTFIFPDSSQVINYYISGDSIVDLKNIVVYELEVKIRSKHLQLDLSKDTIIIN